MSDEAAGHPDGMAEILAFDTNSPEFARGFEAGRLWALLRERPGRVDEVVHAVNSEMILRMGEATGRRASGQPLDETWTRIHFDPEGVEDG